MIFIINVMRPHFIPGLNLILGANLIPMVATVVNSSCYFC